MVNRPAKPLGRDATPLITGHSQGRRPAAPSASSTPDPLGVALKAQHQVRHKIAGADLLAHVLPAKEALERLFHLLEDAKLFHGGLAGWKLRPLSLLACSGRPPVLFLCCGYRCIKIRKTYVKAHVEQVVF